MITAIKEHIANDAIAGHEAAITKLKASIAEREKRIKSIKWAFPHARIAMSQQHYREVLQLELLELCASWQNKEEFLLANTEFGDTYD